MGSTDVQLDIKKSMWNITGEKRLRHMFYTIVMVYHRQADVRTCVLMPLLADKPDGGE